MQQCSKIPVWKCHPVEYQDTIQPLFAHKLDIQSSQVLEKAETTSSKGSVIVVASAVSNLSDSSPSSSNFAQCPNVLPLSSSPSPDGCASFGFYEASGGAGPCSLTHSGFPSFLTPRLPFAAEVTFSSYLVVKSCVTFLGGESLSTIPAIPCPLPSVDLAAAPSSDAASVFSPCFLKQIANVYSSLAPFRKGARNVNSIPGHIEGEDLAPEGGGDLRGLQYLDFFLDPPYLDSRLEESPGVQQNAPGVASMVCLSNPFAVLQSYEVILTEATGEIECNQVDIDIEQQSVTSCEHLSCLGRPDPGSAKGGVLVGNEALMFQEDQAAKLKPQNKAPRETADDQQTSLGYQELQSLIVAGVHMSGLIHIEVIGQDWHQAADVDIMKPCSGRPVPSSAPDHFNEAGSPGKVVDDQEDAQMPEGEAEESLVNERDGHAQTEVNVPLCGSSQQEDITEDRHHAPYADILKCEIISIDDEKHGAHDAHMSIRPIIDANRLDALGISNCHEEEIGSLDHHRQDGDPRPYTNIEQLRMNIANMRKHLAVPGALVIDEFHIPHSNAWDTSSEGFKLKSILKKPKKPKNKRSPSSSSSNSSNSHV
ncbi:hypothetical protein Nepgr_025395 [Nepenthes gracilis]|uniref:Uncharacterized protein n=1 Tax=Nepenthes gracilis TaxID=150966 RepID=A0AAD3T7P5_NEPGR|nr:hypothetical protein Nepgr_025395 [Nepenthes gracilis]